MILRFCSKDIIITNISKPQFTIMIYLVKNGEVNKSANKIVFTVMYYLLLELAL